MGCAVYKPCPTESTSQQNISQAGGCARTETAFKRHGLHIHTSRDMQHGDEAYKRINRQGTSQTDQLLNTQQNQHFDNLKVGQSIYNQVDLRGGAGSGLKAMDKLCLSLTPANPLPKARTIQSLGAEQVCRNIPQTGRSGEQITRTINSLDVLQEQSTIDLGVEQSD